MNTYFNEEQKNIITPEDHLEQFVSGGTRIFIDTCSMLEDSFPLFLEHMIPLLKKHDNRIIVPLAVCKELGHHLENPSKPELRRPAIRALQILEQYKDSYLRILGENSDSFPDNLFQELYIQFRQEFRMLFITQDKGLAVDILNNNDSNSVRAYAAVVKRITPQGYLNSMQVIRENGKWIVPKRETVAVDKIFSQQSAGAFRTCEKPTGMLDEVLPLTEVPGEYDVVYAMNPRTEQFAELELGELIASGGEGSVYKTNTNFAAKIFKEDKVTARRRKKVLLMTKKELEYGGISFPVIPLFNSHSEFVGYLMKKAVGEELRTSIFCPIPKFREKHPDWKREDLVRLCITILRKIEYLHSKNIIMGDINPGNILVKSPTEVFFVDTDSYQIEDLPCPVGQCNYTAPEIQGKEYNSFLRTMGNENFAIATLLFQILLPGKLPYSHAGGGKQNENILEMNFPYCLGENGNKNEPGGQWKFMWSHLTYAVKEAFYNTFQKGMAHADESHRLSAAEWIEILSKYHTLLHRGILAKNDPMSESIFPTRFKAGNGALWAVCKHCGERFPYYKSNNGKNSNPPSYCPECRKTICEWVTCEDCGEEFPIYVPELDFYKGKNYEIPKRCPACRKKRKEYSEKRQLAAKKKHYGGLEFNQKIPGQPYNPKRIPNPPASKPAVTQKPDPGPVITPAPSPASSPSPVVTQRRDPMPAPGPVVTQRQDPAPAPSPVVIQRRDPLLAPSPVVTQHRDPMPAPGPVVTQRQDPMPVPSPVVTQRRDPAPAPSPVVIQRRDPLLAPSPIVTQSQDPTPYTAPVPVPIYQPVYDPIPAPAYGGRKKSALERFHKWLAGI